MLDFMSKEELINMIIETVENDDRFLKIFAFNLGYTLTDEAFRKAFEPFGNIKDSRLARDQSSNQPRGFGFVVFDNPVSSLKAFEAGVSFEGKPAKLKYQYAPQNAPKSRDPDPKAVVDEKFAKEKRKIHVNGIPKEWKNADLENYFKQFGEIEEAFVCFEKGTQNSRGFGFVTFAKKEDYDKILEPATREEEAKSL
ncbi:uncharacterized protein [Blastocystis hominis]|uniref:RRM domain-containing protein n=1 Tax=Blastocystis hominis TaxID=12968 RepID=D8LXH9_BLAHO|nr:uncharacterized protein [Blastocystis hominis]CBK20974.2 unnamed protein product [Blastocystis hominis]|eukprot:XP_012895022.1 uncharacterized protein [Blastocystis hominis]